jgi:hypothetical protein
MRMNMALTLKDINLLDIGNTIQMAGALYIGKGKAYLVSFPDDQDEVRSLPVEHLEMTVEDWQAFLRQTDLLEVQAASGSNEKAILRKSTRQIEQMASWNVYRRDKYACRYCGNDKIPLTVDHLVRWEEGGPSIEANLVASCRKCNKTRGDMSYADWLKDPFYLRVSAKLKPEVRAANEALLPTLAGIPRKKHISSR